MDARRLRRWALVASPFVLLALGTWALEASPWPAILGLTLKGRHVYVPTTWRSTGLGLAALACMVGALAISFTIKRREPDTPPPARRRRR